MARLDTLVRRAVETINLLKRDKQELTARVAQLDELLEQERSNTRQRDKLFQSNRSEVDHFAEEINELKTQRAGQDSLIVEQAESITKLEEELTEIATKLAEKEQLVIISEASSRDQTELESKLNAAARERDEMRAKVYQFECEAAGWAVTLTKEDAKKAEKAVDVIIKRIDQVEKRVGLHQKNGVAEPVLQPEIFNAE